MNNHYLVGGFNHLEKYESQWEGFSLVYYGKYKMFETTNQIKTARNWDSLWYSNIVCCKIPQFNDSMDGGWGDFQFLIYTLWLCQNSYWKWP
jgi:hypothetical protein